VDVLTCPKCREETLECRERLVYERSGAGAETPPPLEPARCTRCRGLWLTRDDIARLRAGSVSMKLEAPEAPPADPEADRRGGLCPDCGRILVRTFLGGEASEEGGGEDGGFYLDRCAHCGGIWFDAGEWHELAADPSIEDLSHLWDPEWRRSRLEERNRKANLARLAERLGPELFEAVEDLISRLRAEPDKRAAALAHMHEELGYEPP
jgi:Zn-finger nucleic acid-binding protein